MIDSEVCFIKPVTLLGFHDKFDDLQKNSTFSFLASTKEYKKYYEKFEKPTNVFQNNKDLAKIEYPLQDGVESNFKYLMPLNKKHSLHSYWKTFRYRLKTNLMEGRADLEDELFLMLPLVMEIDSGTVKVNKQNYSFEYFAYLFPFGSICFNMNVKFDSKIDFSDLIEAILRLPTSSTINGGTFNSRSKDISQLISENIFGKNHPGIAEFKTHTMIFIKKTDQYLTYDPINNENDVRTIYACLKSKRIEDVSTIDINSILNEINSSQMKSKRNKELLFFTPANSFFYASPLWVSTINNPEPISCMLDNYQSFFNIIFAVKRFLSDSEFFTNLDIADQRKSEIKKAFKSIDINSNEEHIFFKHALEITSKKLGMVN